MKLFSLCIYGWLQFNPHADPLDSWGSQHVSTWLAGSQQDFIRDSSAVEEGLNLLPPTTVKELLKVEISRKGKLHIQHSMEQVMGPAMPPNHGTHSHGIYCLSIYPKNQKYLLPLGLKAMQQMGFSWAGKWATMPSLSESSLTRTWGTEHSPGLAGKNTPEGNSQFPTQGSVCKVSHSQCNCMAESTNNPQEFSQTQRHESCSKNHKGLSTSCLDFL